MSPAVNPGRPPAPANSASPDKMTEPVDVHLTGGSHSGSYGYVWCHTAAFRIRNEFRILGDFCGTLPKHTAQNQYLSLPLVLSYDEVMFGHSRGFFRLISDNPADYKTARQDEVEAFEGERRADEERQADEAVRHQEAERARQKAKNAGNGGEAKRKRPREEAQPAPVPQKKLPRVTDLPLLPRMSFRFRSMLHGLLPAFASKPELEGGGDGEVCNGEAPELLVEMPEEEEEVVATREDAIEAERSRLLRARLKQQARSTTLIITATGARDDETGSRGVVKDIPVPNGLCLEKLRLRQAVYCDLHGKGYYMSCGAKFGADFLAYAGDPQLFHAALAIVVRDADDEVSPHDIVALGRLGDSTKKRTVLAYVETLPTGKEVVDYLGLQWEETLP